MDGARTPGPVHRGGDGAQGREAPAGHRVVRTGGSTEAMSPAPPPPHEGSPTLIPWLLGAGHWGWLTSLWPVGDLNQPQMTQSRASPKEPSLHTPRLPSRVPCCCPESSMRLPLSPRATLPSPPETAEAWKGSPRSPHLYLPGPGLVSVPGPAGSHVPATLSPDLDLQVSLLKDVAATTVPTPCAIGSPRSSWPCVPVPAAPAPPSVPHSGSPLKLPGPSSMSPLPRILLSPPCHLQ